MKYNHVQDWAMLEDGNYELALGKCEYGADDNQFVPQYLFKVTYIYEWRKVEVYVLARDEENAIAQSYAKENIGWDKDNISSVAERIPFLIRGWGKTEF